MLTTLLLAAAAAEGEPPTAAPLWVLGAGLGSETAPVVRETVSAEGRGPRLGGTEVSLPADTWAGKLAVERRITDRWWLGGMFTGTADRRQVDGDSSLSEGATSGAGWSVVSRGAVRLTVGPRVELMRGPVDLSLTTGLTAAVAWVGVESLDADGATVGVGDLGALSVGARVGFALDRALAGPLAVRIGCGLIEADRTWGLNEGIDDTVSEVVLRLRASLLLLWRV